MASHTIRAIGAAPGIGLGRAWIYREPADSNGGAAHPVSMLPMAQRTAELDRLRHALADARLQLQDTAATVTTRTGAAEGAVFEAQALLLDDPALVGPLETAVRETGLSAAAAVESAFEEAAHELEALDDPYLSGRAADVRDVKTRLLYLLEGKEERTLADAGESAVIIARDLTPSDTASLEPGQVRGIILAEGTPTAHATILARGLGLPLVIGAGAQAWEIEQGQDVLLDGDEGTVLIEPDEQERKRYHLHAASVSAGGLTTSDGSTFLTTTADGRRIVLLANASTPAEAALAAERGAEGIGLLRTEFLLAALTRDRSEAPNERDLAAAYGAVFEHILGKPVIVRVMDAGGDKPLPFLGFGQEANPFLGWRGIRILLDRPELFADQVRAVLRAAAEHGIDLRLMFPMISSVEEFLRARQMVETVVKEGDFPLAHPLEIGAMIEVPAAALIAEDLAREADFFSIGTNDLVQYTLACDRGNPRVSGLCDVSHPAVLRLIDMTVSAAHSAGKLVGVCGEAAGDPESIPLLLELGVDELSVGPARLAEVRRSVQTLRVGEPARSS